MKNNVIFPIKVNPGKSIGKLQLGMTHEEILRAIHEMRMDWGDSNESDVEITKDMEFDGLRCMRFLGYRIELLCKKNNYVGYPYRDLPLHIRRGVARFTR